MLYWFRILASFCLRRGASWLNVAPCERSRLHFLLFRRDSPEKIAPEDSMADVPTAGAARYASVAEVRADVERAGGDASALCGFGRCFCVKTALGITRKERGHWPQFQESERASSSS